MTQPPSPLTMLLSRHTKRREFITLLGGAAAAWPIAARAQQTAPLIGFVISGGADSFAIFVEAFTQGMRDNGMGHCRDYVLDLHYADGYCGRLRTRTRAWDQRKPARDVVTTLTSATPAPRASSPARPAL